MNGVMLIESNNLNFVAMSAGYSQEKFLPSRPSTPLSYRSRSGTQTIGFQSNEDLPKVEKKEFINRGTDFASLTAEDQDSDYTIRPIFNGITSRCRQNTACSVYARENTKAFCHFETEFMNYRRTHEIDHTSKVKDVLLCLQRGFSLLLLGRKLSTRTDEITNYQKDLNLAYTTKSNDAMSNALSKVSNKITTMCLKLSESIDDFVDELYYWWSSLFGDLQSQGDSIESLLTNGKWINITTLLRKQMKVVIASIISSLDELNCCSLKAIVSHLSTLNLESISTTPNSLKPLQVGYKLYQSINNLKRGYSQTYPLSSLDLPSHELELKCYLSLITHEKAKQLSIDIIDFLDHLLDENITEANNQLNEIKKIRLKKFKRYLLLRWRQEKELFDVLCYGLLHSKYTLGGKSKNSQSISNSTPDTRNNNEISTQTIKDLMLRKGISLTQAQITKLLQRQNINDQEHNTELVDFLSSNLWRDGILFYVRSIDCFYCPVIILQHNRTLYCPTTSDATIGDVQNYTKLVFRSLAVNFEKENSDFDAVKSLLVNASCVQLDATYFDWETALNSFMVTSSKDKCRLIGSGKKEKITQSMGKYLTCFNSLRKMPSSSGAKGSTTSLNSVNDFSEEVSFWRPTVSSQLSLQSQVETGLIWMRCKLQQLLSSGAWDAYFTVSRHDGQIVQSLVNEFDTMLSNCEDIENCNTEYSSYLKRNLTTVKKQLDFLRDYSKWTDTALIKSIKSRTFECLDENFPPIKQWKKRSSKSSGSVIQPNSYVILVGTQVLAPLVASLSVLDEQDATSTLTVCVRSFVETWMSYILKKEIMFSLTGAHQLRCDLNEFQRWLMDLISDLPQDTISSVLSAQEFIQMHDVISLLSCQSQRRRGSHTDSEMSGTSSVSTSSNLSQGSEVTNFDEFIRDVEIPDKEKWLLLRVKGNHNKTKLLCLS